MSTVQLIGFRWIWQWTFPGSQLWAGRHLVTCDWFQRKWHATWDCRSTFFVLCDWFGAWLLRNSLINPSHCSGSQPLLYSCIL